jgi:hypothetical protein
LMTRPGHHGESMEDIQGAPTIEQYANVSRKVIVKCADEI